MTKQSFPDIFRLCWAWTSVHEPPGIYLATVNSHNFRSEIMSASRSLTKPASLASDLLCRDQWVTLSVIITSDSVCFLSLLPAFPRWFKPVRVSWCQLYYDIPQRPWHWFTFHFTMPLLIRGLVSVYFYYVYWLPWDYWANSRTSFLEYHPQLLSLCLCIHHSHSNVNSSL